VRGTVPKKIEPEKPVSAGVVATDESAHDLGRLLARKKQDAELMDEAVMRFSRLFGSGSTDQGFRSADPLIAAMSQVSAFLNIPFSPPKMDFSDAMSAEDQLQEIARNVGIRTRKVALADGWWHRDCGPLIGFTHDGVPVALICGAEGNYLAYTSDGKAVRVTASFAEQMRFFASMLYRSFPDTPVTGKILLRFGISGIESDLIMLVMMGFACSLLSLAVPIVTGLVFDAVIPQAQRDQLWLLCVALSLCAVAGVVFELTKRIALFRVESRMDQHIQGAVWDRLLKLPPAFFRQ
jgi:ATP-binding cassette subfamily C protein